MTAATSVSRFPTRQYPYRSRASGVVLDVATEPLQELPSGTVVRFFVGSDETPVVLTPEDLQHNLNDPFARIVLHPGHRPQTLLALLNHLDEATGEEALLEQRLYRAADGGQIAWSPETSGLDRHLRIVITRHKGEDAELLVSTAPPFSSDTIFLQVFAWDPVLEAYNFYERRRGIWSWAGSSWQALDAPTRGMGPFDSHVNGGPVMKELKAPWLHWHSEASQIRDVMFAPTDPVRTDQLYNGPGLKGGEDLERIIRSGTSRWTNARFKRHGGGGRLERAADFFRHVLTTTTVNLACSPQQSALLSENYQLRLPTTFFLGSDCLIDELKLPTSLTRIKVLGSEYVAALKRYEVKLKDGTTVLDRDTHFAFAVPEPSFEDQLVLRALLEHRVFTRKQAACLLMVDFPNPVFSDRRSALLKYIPSSVAMDDGTDLDRQFFSAIQASEAAGVVGTPEAEIVELWGQTNASWETDFARRIDEYWKSLHLQLSKDNGFDEIFRLSESRRRQFRKEPLAEFGLTLSCATKLHFPAFLKMTNQARVVPT